MIGTRMTGSALGTANVGASGNARYRSVPTGTICLVTGVLEHGGQLAEDDVDGVRTFYVPTGQTPYACLSFRVGRADERIGNHGWTHLLEHLAMHELDHPRIQSNASVGLWTTDFHVKGEPDDVVAFLASLCTWLSEPDFAALEHERAILEAEGERRTGSSMDEHLDYRYGPRGVGLVSYRELGLVRADPAGLTAWAGRWFTSRNAALTMNGPPLPDLRLPLPPGQLQPIPAAVPVLPSALSSGLPAHAGSGAREVAVSGLTNDSALSTLVGEVLAAEVSDELRKRQRVSYGTTVAVERVDADNLLMLLVTDVIEERRVDGVAMVGDVLERVAEHGVDETRLFDARDLMVRALRDDPVKMWQAASSAHASLRGAAPITEDDICSRLETLQRYEVAAQVQRFRDSMLLTSPVGVHSRTRYPFTTGLPQLRVPVEGIEFKAAMSPADPSRIYLTETALVVDDERGGRGGDSEGAGLAGRHGVDLVDPAALLVYPDGARTVISRHGAVVTVETNVWRNGWDLTARLDAMVPTDACVRMPARPVEAVRRAPTTGQWLVTQVAGIGRRRQPKQTGQQTGQPAAPQGGRQGRSNARSSRWVAPLVVGSILTLSALVHALGPWRASADGFERAVDNYFTVALNMPVETDCGGARPKVDEVVECTVTWGPMRRTLIAHVTPASHRTIRVLDSATQGDQLGGQMGGQLPSLVPAGPTPSPAQGVPAS